MSQPRGKYRGRFKEHPENHRNRWNAPHQKEWKRSSQQHTQKKSPYVYDEKSNRFYKVPATITMDSQRELFEARRNTASPSTSAALSLREFLFHRSIGTIQDAATLTSLKRRIIGLSVENTVNHPVEAFSFGRTVEPSLRAFWTNRKTLFVLHQKSITQWDTGKVDRDVDEAGVSSFRSFVNRYTFDSAISVWETNETSDSVELLTGTFGSGTPGKLYVYRQPHFLFRPTVSIMNLRTGSVNAAVAKTDSEGEEIANVLFSDGKRVMLWDLSKDEDGSERSASLRRLCSLSSEAISLCYSKNLHSALAGCRNGCFSLVDARVAREPYTVTLGNRFPITHVQFESSTSYRFLVEVVPTSSKVTSDVLTFYDFRMLTPNAPKPLCSFSGHVPSSDFPRQIIITSSSPNSSVNATEPKYVIAVGGDHAIRWWREGDKTPIYSFNDKTNQKGEAISYSDDQQSQKKNNFAIFYQNNSLWIGKDKTIKRIVF